MKIAYHLTKQVLLVLQLRIGCVDNLGAGAHVDVGRPAALRRKPPWRVIEQGQDSKMPDIEVVNERKKHLLEGIGRWVRERGIQNGVSEGSDLLLLVVSESCLGGVHQRRDEGLICSQVLDAHGPRILELTKCFSHLFRPPLTTTLKRGFEEHVEELESRPAHTWDRTDDGACKGVEMIPRGF